MKMNYMDSSMFVEYIRNNIKEDINKYYKYMLTHIQEKNSKQHIHHRNIKAFVEEEIIKVYKVFVAQLRSKIDGEILKYFNMGAEKLNNDLLNENIYAYPIDTDLIKEYKKTERLSGLMENLVDKTIDMTLLECNNKFMEASYDFVDIKDKLMKPMKENSKFNKNKQIKEIDHMIKGINKNISVRIENELLKHYTRFIYDLVEEWENIIEYKKAA